MKRKKAFDCVEMKTEIQARLLREIADLGEDEARKRRKARLMRDPVLGGFLGKKESTQREPEPIIHRP